MSLPCLQATKEGTALSLHVQPRASGNAVCGLMEGELKIRLTSPPVEGAANKACCAWLAKLFGLPKRSVLLLSGDKSRHKRVLLEGLGVEEAAAILRPLLARRPS